MSPPHRITISVARTSVQDLPAVDPKLTTVRGRTFAPFPTASTTAAKPRCRFSTSADLTSTENAQHASPAPLAQRAHSVRRSLRVNRLPEPWSFLSRSQGLAGAAAADSLRRPALRSPQVFSGVSGRRPPTPNFKSGRLSPSRSCGDRPDFARCFPASEPQLP